MKTKKKFLNKKNIINNIKEMIKEFSFLKKFVKKNKFFSSRKLNNFSGLNMYIAIIGIVPRLIISSKPPI